MMIIIVCSVVCLILVIICIFACLMMNAANQLADAVKNYNYAKKE